MTGWPIPLDLDDVEDVPDVPDVPAVPPGVDLVEALHIRPEISHTQPERSNT